MDCEGFITLSAGESTIHPPEVYKEAIIHLDECDSCRTKFPKIGEVYITMLRISELVANTPPDDLPEDVRAIVEQIMKKPK
jgi:predicted anti-sigma-YlaC factor YlaD